MIPSSEPQFSSRRKSSILASAIVSTYSEHHIFVSLVLFPLAIDAFPGMLVIAGFLVQVD